MRLSIWLFGLSELALRAPALLGGVLYIFSMYRLCMLLAKSIYVLLESRNRDFIRTEGLQAVWRGAVSDLVVLVRP